MVLCGYPAKSSVLGGVPLRHASHSGFSIPLKRELSSYSGSYSGIASRTYFTRGSMLLRFALDVAPLWNSPDEVCELTLHPLPKYSLADTV